MYSGGVKVKRSLGVPRGVPDCVEVSNGFLGLQNSDKLSRSIKRCPVEYIGFHVCLKVSSVSGYFLKSP